MHHNIYRERIWRVNLTPHLTYASGMTMRVWREEKREGLHYPTHAPLPPEIAAKLQSLAPTPMNELDVAREILTLPGVNAVEITDPTGAGEVLYKDWP